MMDARRIEAVKIEVFVPQEIIKPLLDVLHALGVGRIGNYDHCISITQVSGYWRPLKGAKPHVGNIGEVSYGDECKVEINCPKQLIDEALSAVHTVHPYDEPLINIVPLVNHLFEGATAVAP